MSVFAPDSDVADAVATVEGEEVDAVVMSGGTEEVVVDFRSHQIAVRDDGADGVGALSHPPPRTCRMTVLEIVLVFLNVGVVHVDGNATLEGLFVRVPDVGRIQIGVEQIEQRSANRASQLSAVGIIGG